jgi:hypothetical protein
MAEDLPPFSQGDAGGEVEPSKKKARKEKELYVSPGNALARKMIEPYGQNELDAISLEDLWKKASNGDEHCPRFTEYAIVNDKNYPGLALSRSMKNLAAAMTHLKNDEEAGQILDRKIYAKIKTEIDVLLPHVQTLSGGQMRKEGGGRLNAYKAAPVDREVAEGAAKYVYGWLTKSSALRSMLMFLSKGGIFYTAFANEKLTRAYIAGESVKEGQFVDLCMHRLCPPAVSREAPMDWSSLKK